MNCVSPIVAGRQHRSGRTVLERHRHADGYLALVLSGSYEEAGDRGRHCVRVGEVVVHGRFEAHTNRYHSSGAEVLNLPLPDSADLPHVLMQTADPDGIVRMAERDVKEAVNLLLSSGKPVDRNSADWPDLLASALQVNPHLRLQDWARAHHLADATVSRGFQKIFGISPSAYRAQLRGRQAWRLLSTRGEELSALAMRVGFCDQAHMTHTVRNVTGIPPGAWRRQVK